MNKMEKKLPRATAEQVRKYNELVAKINAIDPMQRHILALDLDNERYALENAFDWSNYEFTDPISGKKGVMDVAGKILIPARYDDLTMLGDYIYMHTFPQAVVKNGKFGIVAADGSGKELSDFRFDFLCWQYATDLFMASWDGDKKHYGFVDILGHVVCPNVLTSNDGMPLNDVMVIERDGKYGMIDVKSHQTVLPEYDAIDVEPEEYVVFHKDGKEGYITDRGEFVSIEQYDEDEEGKYDDVYFLNCRF